MSTTRRRIGRPFAQTSRKVAVELPLSNLVGSIAAALWARKNAEKRSGRMILLSISAWWPRRSRGPVGTCDEEGEVTTTMLSPPSNPQPSLEHDKWFRNLEKCIPSSWISAKTPRHATHASHTSHALNRVFERGSCGAATSYFYKEKQKSFPISRCSFLPHVQELAPPMISQSRGQGAASRPSGRSSGVLHHHAACRTAEDPSHTTQSLSISSRAL